MKETFLSVTIIIILFAYWLNVLEYIDLLVAFLFGVTTTLYLLDDGIDDNKWNRRKIYKRKAKRSGIKWNITLILS